MTNSALPLLAITLGDPAGTGPEIIAKALALPEIRALCRPLVVGDAATMMRALGYTGISLKIHAVNAVTEARFTPGEIDVLDLKNVDLARLALGKVDPLAGKAAYEYVKKAT